MAPPGSQRLRAQDPALARRYGTEGRTGHQAREGGNGNGDGSRGGGGDETRTGTGTMTVMRVEIDRRVEGRESLGTHEVVIKVGRKILERRRRRR